MGRTDTDSSETRRLLDRVRSGDTASFERLFEKHRPALRRMVEARLDRRLGARVDPSDVIQDAHLEAFRRLDDYLARRPMPFALWLRKTAYERILNLQRDHVEAARRSIRREVRLPDRSSLQLANRLFAAGPSPSRQFADRELAAQMRAALAELSPDDREILLLRYLDDLSNHEAACLLGISPGTASKRHGRALLRLHRVLTERGLKGSQP
ncbi:MAG: sigma-70 family RNA polymerase sigma factor [Planctomycetes bacterium]|nr:sigma-70 family RNA polymerase sigma factor [Planctomycetota bacterium]